MANYKRPNKEDCCGRNHDDDYRWREDEDHHKERRFPVTILSCGTGSGLTLPISGIGVASPAQSNGGYYPTLVVGTVALDTRGLDNPTVKIDFSSLINFRATSSVGDFFLGIIFQLSRSCDGGYKVPLSTWTFERALAIQGTVDSPTPVWDFRDPFTFTWCECDQCPGCCTYLVEIISINSYNIENASITNVGINAEASGLPERHR